MAAKKNRYLAAIMAAAMAGGIYGCPISTVQAANGQSTAPETKVYVSGYEFQGELPVSAESLQQVLADSRGREMTLGSLEQQAEKVTRYLRSQGYFVAFAYVPVQDVQANRGRVVLQVVPGRYGKVELDNKTRSHDSAVRRELGKVKPGAVVSKDDLERAVWLIGDMAKTEAKTTLRAGKEKGTTDLIVHVKPKGKPIFGYVGIDNGGYRDTGRYEYSAAINYANPFREGDLLSLNGMHTNLRDGMWSGNISYVTPAFAQGNKIGIGYARSNYLLSGNFSALGYNGHSNDLYVYWQTNLKRSRKSNWYVTLRFDAKNMSDSVDAYSQEFGKHTGNWSIGTNGDTLDNWKGGGVTTYSLTYTHGNLSLENSDDQLADDAYTHTSGGFGKYNLNLTRLQKVRDRLALWLSFSGQLASKNLDSSEKMFLGGPFGVRAYPPGEASGDDGWLATAELRWNLPAKQGSSDTWQLITFVDGGAVRLYKDLWEGATGSNHRELYGTGVGVNWSNQSNWAARLHYAWKLGSEDAVSDTDRSGRLWFQLYKFF